MLWALAAVACASTAAPKAPSPAPGQARAFDVAKMREDLQVTPLEVVFSGVPGANASEESVGVRNIGPTPVKITGMEVRGADALVFRIVNPPTFPVQLASGKSLSVNVAFAPGHEVEPGVHRAMLHIFEGGDEGPPVDLAALVARGKQGENEPPLAQVIEALGFATNPGGTQLKLGIGPEPIGDEVKAPRFVRSKATSVSMYPVARYSPDEPVPYGYYTGGTSPELHQLGVIAKGQEQTLNPDLEADGKTTFDPGDEPFGVFVKTKAHGTFTEDKLNIGPTKHACRVYPLKERGGARIPDAYIVAFEEASNGDYQDFVFVIWNVKAAP